MNGLSFSDLCCLFCCPPCPGRIASKLGRTFFFFQFSIILQKKNFSAFLPPEASYELKPDETSSTKFALNLTEKADWQYTERDKECFETFFARSARGNKIACLFARCSSNARYFLLPLFFFLLQNLKKFKLFTDLHYCFLTEMPLTWDK